MGGGVHGDGVQVEVGGVQTGGTKLVKAKLGCPVWRGSHYNLHQPIAGFKTSKQCTMDEQRTMEKQRKTEKQQTTDNRHSDLSGSI